MHYYQFHISDWVLHTSHLTLEEEAVYRRLLDYYYDTERPIPIKTQSVIRRLRLGLHSDIVDLILNEFFVEENDGWHNLRADQEIADYHKKAEIARENGRKGGRPKKQSKEKQGVTENENPEETQPVFLANPEETGSKANQEPRTSNEEPETKVKGVKTPICPHQEIVDLYHKKLPTLPNVKIWGEPRKKKLQARWRESGERQSLDWWSSFFDDINNNCKFLLGENDRNWSADLEWIITPKNFVKIIEGKYRENNGKQQNQFAGVM